MTDPYEFPGLPIPDIEPGTNLLLSGPMHGGVRDLGARMVGGEPGEGTIIVTTNQSARRLISGYERAGIDFGPDTLSIVDCTDDAADIDAARVLPVSGPTDLTGIGIRFSDACKQFAAEDIDRLRTGVFSLSTLLSFSELRTVSRFVHTLAGRVASTDGVGFYLIDPDMHDRQTVSTVAQFCDGRIELREGADGTELRTKGIPSESGNWRLFDLQD